MIIYSAASSALEGVQNLSLSLGFTLSKNTHTHTHTHTDTHASCNNVTRVYLLNQIKNWAVRYQEGWRKEALSCTDAATDHLHLRSAAHLWFILYNSAFPGRSTSDVVWGHFKSKLEKKRPPKEGT